MAQPAAWEICDEGDVRTVYGRKEGLLIPYTTLVSYEGSANPGDLAEGWLGRIKGLVFVAILRLAFGAVPSSESSWVSAR